MIGHTLGAAGAIEAIVTIQTMREGCVPPTINLHDVDPEGEGLDLTPNVAQPPRHPDRPLELVRLRRPEHGPDLPAVARVTDDLGAVGGGGPEPVATDPASDLPRTTPTADRTARDDADARRALDPGDASLLALVDRLGALLDRSDLSELAVESGGTRLVLRKAVAIAAGAGRRGGAAASAQARRRRPGARTTATAPSAARRPPRAARR